MDSFRCKQIQLSGKSSRSNLPSAVAPRDEKTYLGCLIKEKNHPIRVVFSIIRHRAIFPRKRSIVTAARLNFCVRHGNRCFPCAMGTEIRSGIHFQSSEKRLAWGFTRQNFDVQYWHDVFELLMTDIGTRPLRFLSLERDLRG